jgi:hypothetical protein
MSSQRAENVAHEAIAQSGEEDKEEGDIVNVIEANCVLSRGGVVVGELEEGPCVDPRLGNDQVAEKEKGHEIEDDDWGCQCGHSQSN